MSRAAAEGAQRLTVPQGQSRFLGVRGGGLAIPRSECARRPESESTAHAHFPNQRCRQKTELATPFLRTRHTERVKGPLSRVWVQQPATFAAALMSDQIKCRGVFHMYFFYYSVKGNKIYRTKLFLF